MNAYPLIRALVLLTTFSTLSGCVVMTESDCLRADWRQVGYDVGFEGEQDSSSAFNKRASICAKHGASADSQAFEDGYKQGIDDYCEDINAVDLGRRGVTKAVRKQICPELDYPGFASAFNAGYKLFELQRQANEIGYQIEQLLEDQYRYQQQLWGFRQQIQSGRLNDRERRKAGYYRQQLRRNLDDISSRIYYYQSRLSERQTAADTYAELLELEYSDDSF